MEEENSETKKDSALQAIKQKIHIAQINVNYTVYYPLSEKYISLYPQDKNKNKKTSTTEDEDEDGSDSDDELPQKSGTTKNEKPPLWSIVEKCTANGTLDKLRNGKLNIGFDGKPKPKAAAVETSSSSSQKTREKATSQSAKRSDSKAASKAQKYKHEEEDNDDDSDRGFFET